jgi:hypothetical protein
MDVLFNKVEGWVGFERPKPLESNLHTLVYQCLSSTIQSFIKDSVFMNVGQCHHIPKIDFSNLITEVLNACKIPFPSSTLYMGENEDQWLRLMPKCLNNIDLIWDESIELCGRQYKTKYYIFKLLNLSSLEIITHFKSVYFVSPIESFGQDTYIVCTNEVNSIQVDITNTWIQFCYRQQEQKNQFLKLFQWAIENNKDAEWFEEVFIPQSPIYIPSE